MFFLNANSCPAREEISSDDGGGPLLLIMKDQETLRFSFKKISLLPKGIIKSNFFRQILMLYFLCRNSFVMILLVICRKFWWFSILNLICLNKTYKASRA